MGIWYRMGKVPRAEDSSPMLSNCNPNVQPASTANNTPAPVMPKYVRTAQISGVCM